jgi:protein translocase subunit secA
MGLCDYKFKEEDLIKLDHDDLVEFIAKMFNNQYDILRQNILEKFGVVQLTNSERNIILNVFDGA